MKLIALGKTLPIYKTINMKTIKTYVIKSYFLNVGIFLFTHLILETIFILLSINIWASFPSLIIWGLFTYLNIKNKYIIFKL